MAPILSVTWPRFGLRTLLLLLTVGALASWAYWDLWPKLKQYRAQQPFLEQAKELKRGQLISEAWRPTLTTYGPPFISDSGRHDAKGRYTRSLVCSFPNKLYVVFWRFKDSRCSSVEVFGLPAAPKDYVAKTERSRIDAELEARHKANYDPRWPQPRSNLTPSQLAYRRDFIEMIAGDRQNDLGFNYTLIHSDPPTE